jgi:hypothetical protein
LESSTGFGGLCSQETVLFIGQRWHFRAVSYSFFSYLEFCISEGPRDCSRMSFE